MKTFVEVGSCDFDNLIHLSDYGWKGIVVEPIKEYLDNVERRKNVEYVNAAVDLTSGVKPFYTPPKVWCDIDKDYKGMGTLVPFIEETHIVKIMVNTITWENLIKKYNISNIDYLKIDTEGYDFILLKNFPYNKIKPKFIKFEHNLDCYTEEMREEIGMFLKEKNYHLEWDKQNCYCILI